MNDLYRAVEILGRSIDDVDMYGWGWCHLGSAHNADKCVNGVLTIAAYRSESWYAAESARPVYINQIVRDGRPYLDVPMRLVSQALLQTAPADIVAKLIDDDVWDARMAQNPFVCDLEAIGEALVQVNDAYTYDEHKVDEEGDPIQVPMLTRVEARAWYSRALDLLAKELPEPLPTLTVDDILSTPMVEPDCTGYVCDTHKSLQHDGDTCPVHEAV